MQRRAVSQPVGAIVALLAATAAPFRLTELLISAKGGRVERGIRFGSLKRRELDVYHPVGPRAGDDDAIIIFIYGGGWRVGGRRDYGFAARSFAAAGFTTVVPDYRLYPWGRFPDFVEDVAAAAAWVQAELVDHGAAPRIVLVGHSAGAHIAALLALDPRYLEAEGLSTEIIKGWVGLAGPYALNPLKTYFTKAVFAAASDDVDQAMPVALARAGAPPALLLHGTADAIVFPWNSEVMADALRAAGGKVTHRPLDGVGHVGMVLSIARPGLGGAPVLDAIKDFARAAVSDADQTKRAR